MFCTITDELVDLFCAIRLGLCNDYIYSFTGYLIQVLPSLLFLLTRNYLLNRELFG